MESKKIGKEMVKEGKKNKKKKRKQEESGAGGWRKDREGEGVNWGKIWKKSRMLLLFYFLQHVGLKGNVRARE